MVVDACTPRVVQAGFDQGKLPHLQELSRAGFRDDECSAIFPSITPAATASIVTGRYPAEHGIVGAHWYDKESRDIVYYGDDVDVIWRRGFGEFFDNFLVGLNARRLEADTLFDTVERGGLRAACINHIVFRGPAWHDVHVPLLLRALPGVPRATRVPGPGALYLGDLVSTPLAATGRRPRHAGGPRHRFGLDDQGTADVLVELVRAGLPDLTVAYFADYDYRAHEVGPAEALPALEAFDRHLGAVFAAAGGLDGLLRECCVVLTADHAQTAVARGERASVPLQQTLRGLEIADAGRPWRPEDDVKVCVNMRSAQVYYRRPEPEVLERTAAQLLENPDVDQVLWKKADGEPGYEVATREHGRLRFRPGDAGPNPVRDAWGQAWTCEGDLAAVGAAAGADGTLREGEYPNPLERIRCALEAPEAGQLWMTAVPGVELTLGVTSAHRGGGAHGSLHERDSRIPLLVAGAPREMTPRGPTRTVDVAPLCLELLGLRPERAVGESHVAGDRPRRPPGDASATREER